MSKKILIADDDPHILEVVVFALEKANMVTVTASDGRQAIEIFHSSSPDLIVLDVNMPEMDGLDVCKEIRKTSEVPILFLSSRDEEIDRILGLEIGGDDYLTKPFSPRELVARLKAILKRSAPQEKAENNISEIIYGDLKIFTEKHQVFWNEHEVKLTATEFSILCGMAKYPDHVFNRDKIMDMAYEMNINVSDRTIDSHIRNLRHKFSVLGYDDIIQTVHGVGYKLSA